MQAPCSSVSSCELVVFKGSGAKLYAALYSDCGLHSPTSIVLLQVVAL